MNWDQVEGRWKELKGSVRERWGKLTDDDLDVIAGKREQLAGKLQQQYGYARARAEKEIDEFLDERDRMNAAAAGQSTLHY